MSPDTYYYCQACDQPIEGPIHWDRRPVPFHPEHAPPTEGEQAASPEEGIGDATGQPVSPERDRRTPPPADLDRIELLLSKGCKLKKIGKMYMIVHSRKDLVSRGAKSLSEVLRLALWDLGLEEKPQPKEK